MATYLAQYYWFQYRKATSNYCLVNIFVRSVVCVLCLWLKSISMQGTLGKGLPTAPKFISNVLIVYVHDKIYPITYMTRYSFSVLST